MRKSRVGIGLKCNTYELKNYDPNVNEQNHEQNLNGLLLSKRMSESGRFDVSRMNSGSRNAEKRSIFSNNNGMKSTVWQKNKMCFQSRDCRDNAIRKRNVAEV